MYVYIIHNKEGLNNYVSN